MKTDELIGALRNGTQGAFGRPYSQHSIYELMQAAADRLEEQEQKIRDLEKELDNQWSGD